jgi:hypothetical protein
MVRFLFCVVSLCALTAFGCGKGTPYYKDAQADQSTPTPVPTASVDPYLAIKAATNELTKLPSSVRLDPKGYIKGDVVQYEQTIDREDKDKKEKPTWRVEQLVLLQDKVPPQKVDGVSTVVLRKCEEVSTGSYGTIAGHEVVGDDVKGFGWKCEITVVDKTIPAVIARKTFEAKPDEYKSVSANTKVITVPPPLTEMRDYLKSLERR